MRVGVFLSPWTRVQKPTGVGRHAVEMTRQLSTQENIDLSVFATSGECNAAKQALSPHDRHVRMNLLPGSERLVRLMLIGTGWPGVDRWSDDLDWVYCPKEQPVATQRARLAVTVHDVLIFDSVPGLDMRSTLGERLRWTHVMRRIRRADLIAAVSEFTKERLVRLCDVQASRIAVVGNGVTPEYFRYAAPGDDQVLDRYKVRSREFFVAAGSLTKRKGGDLLLRSAVMLRKLGYQAPILVLGRRHEPDLLALKEALAQELGGTMRLVGFVSDQDQAVLLSHSLALLFPSRYEGFGIPALEAMAAGTVVVCSRAAALPEIAGNAARFVEPNSVGNLVDEMVMLLRGQIDRDRLIALGRERASQFTWSRCCERLLASMSMVEAG